MKINFKIKKGSLILLICFISAFLAAGIVYALDTINTIAGGFKIGPVALDSATTRTIDLTASCGAGNCKIVTKNTGSDVFIPTKSCTEWNAFKLNANAAGVNLAPCAASAPCPGIPTVIYDGDTYNTVQIGSQCWLKQNLNVTHNPFGSSITRYCYNNDTTICDGADGPGGSHGDGGLYTWFTAMNGSVVEGVQGICPTGWHIPKDSEWYDLESGLTDFGQTCNPTRFGYDCFSAGTKLALGGSSGFDAIFPGYKNTTPVFYNRGSDQATWSSTEEGAGQALNRYIIDGNSQVYRETGPPTASKNAGFSVRCLKDATSPFQVTGLTATSGNAQVVLNWTTPASDGGSAITNYKVYRSTISGGETLLITLGNVLTYTDTGLTNGTVYYYKVSAVNAIGEGPLSNEANATPSIYINISSVCSGIDLYYTELSATYSWKTSKTACDIPQCGQDGGQYLDNLVADNSIDFSLYPARDACKAVGGRLPTTMELGCIYDKCYISGNCGSIIFSNQNYWSSSEYTIDRAFFFNFSTGAGAIGHFKTNKSSVICVRSL